MSNRGKCTICAKTVYDLECVSAGPPTAKKVYHKGCFKCTTCGWQLTLTNYTFWDGFIYCKNHYPVTGFGDGTAKHVSGEVKTTDYGLETSMKAPKLDTVNQQVKQTGSGTVTTDSIHIKKATEAPKLDTVNQQVRNTGSGTVTSDSIHIKKATDAPKLDTARANVRLGSDEQVGVNTTETPVMKTALNAPKNDLTFNQHVRVKQDQ